MKSLVRACDLPGCCLKSVFRPSPAASRGAILFYFGVRKQTEGGGELPEVAGKAGRISEDE